MSVHIVRLGSPRTPAEGLRLGTVRRPPRGVPKSEYARRDFYDVWLPELAPSAAIIKLALHNDSVADWREFVRRYRREMSAPACAHLLEMLAALSHHASFAVGCYCVDEARCHRSLLRVMLVARGADLA